MAQRILCCRGVREARLAVSFSIVAVLVGLVVAWSGIALAAWYDAHPLDGEAWRLVSEKADRILPVFTATVLPEGLRGFVVAGVFAAAISSLDGVLAALAQTTMHAWWLPRRQRRVAALAPTARPSAEAEERRSIAVSRRLVVAYGALMVAVAWAMDPISRAYASLLDLGLAMAGYTQGALLGAFLLALLRPSVGSSGWVWGAPASLLLVYGAAWHGPGPRLALAVASAALLLAWFARGRAGRRRGATLALVAVLGLASWLCAHGWTTSPSGTLQSLAWPWYVPLGCAASIVLGLLLARVDDQDARDVQA
jgi:Na+/proline symporter